MPLASISFGVWVIGTSKNVNIIQICSFFNTCVVLWALILHMHAKINRCRSSFCQIMVLQICIKGDTSCLFNYCTVHPFHHTILFWRIWISLWTAKILYWWFLPKAIQCLILMFKNFCKCHSYVSSSNNMKYFEGTSIGPHMSIRIIYNI